MKIYNNIRNSLLVLSLLAVSACGGIFSPVGIIAEQQKSLIIITILLMLIVVIPVLVLSVIIPLKYREKNKDKADYKPEWNHSMKLEVVWWGVPIIIIVILAIITWQTSHSLDPYKPLESKKQPIKVQVISLNWKWLFIYPDYSIATVNYMQIPVDVPVNLELTSDAPMNSFWIPQVAGQIYTMTGMATKLHISVNKKGQYEGLSSNYSGDGFADMKFVLNVTSKEDFEKWVNQVKSSDKRLTQKTYNKLMKDSINHSVEYYGFVKPTLFNDMMMKYMGHEVHDDSDIKSNNHEHYKAHATN